MEDGILTCCFIIYILTLLIVAYIQKPSAAQPRRKTWWEEYRDRDR